MWVIAGFFYDFPRFFPLRIDRDTPKTAEMVCARSFIDKSFDIRCWISSLLHDDFARHIIVSAKLGIASRTRKSK